MKTQLDFIRPAIILPWVMGLTPQATLRRAVPISQDLGVLRLDYKINAKVVRLCDLSLFEYVTRGHRAIQHREYGAAQFGGADPIKAAVLYI